MADIIVKVNPVTTNKVKQVAIGQVAAENFELNDLKNVDIDSYILKTKLLDI